MIDTQSSEEDFKVNKIAKPLYVEGAWVEFLFLMKFFQHLIYQDSRLKLITEKSFRELPMFVVSLKKLLILRLLSINSIKLAKRA
jgi:hypothetical protein